LTGTEERKSAVKKRSKDGEIKTKMQVTEKKNEIKASQIKKMEKIDKI
jgi:hypothetical protein